MPLLARTEMGVPGGAAPAAAGELITSLAKDRQMRWPGGEGVGGIGLAGGSQLVPITEPPGKLVRLCRAGWQGAAVRQSRASSAELCTWGAWAWGVTLGHRC